MFGLAFTSLRRALQNFSSSMSSSSLLCFLSTSCLKMLVEFWLVFGAVLVFFKKRAEHLDLMVGSSKLGLLVWRTK